MRVIIHPTYFSNLFPPFSLFPFSSFFLYKQLSSLALLPLSPPSFRFSRKNSKRIAFNPKCLQFDETRVSLSKTVVNSRPVKQRVTVILINVIRVNPIHIIAKRFIHLDPSVSHFFIHAWRSLDPSENDGDPVHRIIRLSIGSE